MYNIKSSIEDKLKEKVSQEDAETVKKAVSDTLEWLDVRCRPLFPLTSCLLLLLLLLQCRGYGSGTCCV